MYVTNLRKNHLPSEPRSKMVREMGETKINMATLPFFSSKSSVVHRDPWFVSGPDTTQLPKLEG